jgi:erythronate-4-phosphate dehydrogenase
MKLAGKVLGILGVGNIGSRVERTARKLDMQPLLYDPPRARKEGTGSFVTLDEILEKSDFLALHVPLTKDGQDKTEGLLDEDFFEGLRKAPFLVNTARGAVVDTGAVTNALKKDRLGGIVFDVWENEPHIDLTLLEKALLATPHIAGYSREGKFNATSLVVQAVANFAGIQPIPPIPYPLPPPEKVRVADGNKGTQDVLEAVFRTICPLLKETGALKKNPGNFMEHRKNYTLRRDNSGIQLELEECNPDCRARLYDLEFNMVEI